MVLFWVANTFETMENTVASPIKGELQSLQFTLKIIVADSCLSSLMEGSGDAD